MELIGSPFSAVIYPGEVKSALCSTSVTASDILQLRAGITYFFTITFRDIYNNLHYQTLSDDDVKVDILATYVNHNEWPSPISIADSTDWQAVYGSDIAGIASDNNDGTMTG